MTQPAESDDDVAKGQFLKDSRNAILATNRRDGPPQQSPVWFLWANGQFVISVGEQTAKAANIRRDPRISLCIDDFAGARHLVASGQVGWIDSLMVRDQALRLVAKYLPPAEVLPYWEDVERRDPQRLISLRPTRYIWFGFQSRQNSASLEDMT